MHIHEFTQEIKLRLKKNDIQYERFFIENQCWADSWDDSNINNPELKLCVYSPTYKGLDVSLYFKNVKTQEGVKAFSKLIDCAIENAIKQQIPQLDLK
jgi:hypothetical protein